MPLSGAHNIGDTGHVADHNLIDNFINTTANATFQTVYAVAAPSGDATGAADTSNIQAKINAAGTAGGGIVVLRPGTYGVTQLTMKTGVRLVGAGTYQTTLKMVSAATAVILNASWSASPASWSVTETDYGVYDLTVDSNKAVVTSFTYGINFQRFARVQVMRVRAINAKTGSGIVCQQGSVLTVSECVCTGCDGNGIFVVDCLNFTVNGNQVLDAGDFGIEVGSGYDYGTAGGTAYCGDGTVVGNRVANCTNYGIGLRGYVNAPANPNNHYVQSVVVSGNTVRDSANNNEIAYYELARNITVFGNNKAHGGVQVLETARVSADLASVNFTSAGFGAVADITGLSVAVPLGRGKNRCEIKLRVRANSSAIGTNAIYVLISPAPLTGQALISAVQAGTAGNDQEFVVINDVILDANTAYTIKAQFFQGTSGTFTVQGSAQNTELIAVSTPLT